MERTVPSPAWASNVCFNSSWTKLFVSLSLSSLFVSKNSHKDCGFYVPTPLFFLSIHRAKSRGIPLREHASAQIMEFRCEGLGSCNFAANNYRHLLSLHREVAVLQAANSSAWSKLKWGKDLLKKSLSALRTIDSCDLIPHWSLFQVARSAAN